MIDTRDYYFNVSVHFGFSSYGQSLATSTFVGETLFAILIAIFGLVLFAHLIGNMQVLLPLLFTTITIASFLLFSSMKIYFIFHGVDVFAIDDGEVGRVEAEEEGHRGVDDAPPATSNSTRAR